MIFSGRILHGIGEGIGVALSIIYLGELIEEKYRGGAIASVTVSCQVGIALAYIFGVAFPWRVGAGVVAIINFASLLCTLILQESQPWLELKMKLKQFREKLFLILGYLSLSHKIIKRSYCKTQ